LPFAKKEKPFGMRVDGVAHKLGDRFHDHHPATVAIGIAVMGALVLMVIVVGLGLSLTEGLLSGPLGRWDERVNDWFLAHRTAGFDPWAHLGSTIAMTGSVVAVLVVVVIVLSIARRWTDAAFLVIALAVEVSVFLIATLLVARSRPTVPQLEPAPPTSSFPSGHTAAAIALYVGLAMLLSPHVRSTGLKVLVWVVAISIPVFVAISRVYAGMHHVTDVLASVIVGAGALMVASLAIRTAIVVRDARAARHETTDRRVLVSEEVAG
jgi:membrane-associated phospholipid phosphatase